MVRKYNISKGGKVSDSLSRFPIYQNQMNTHESNYKKKVVSEINDTEELPEGIFLINLKLINQYQQKYPSLKAKYKMGKYKKCSFCGGSNINLNIIMCEDRIVIPSILKSCLLHWYHTYLLHKGMDRTEAMICQHLYLTSIGKSVWKKGTNYDTCQHTKWSNKNVINYQLRKLKKHHGNNSV